MVGGQPFPQLSRRLQQLARLFTLVPGLQPLLKICCPRVEVRVVLGASVSGPNLDGRQRPVIGRLDEVLDGIVLVGREENPPAAREVTLAEFGKSSLDGCDHPGLAGARRTLDEDQILRVDGEVNRFDLRFCRSTSEQGSHPGRHRGVALRSANSVRGLAGEDQRQLTCG